MEETSDQPPATVLSLDQRGQAAVFAVINGEQGEMPLSGFIDKVVEELKKPTPADGDGSA